MAISEQLLRVERWRTYLIEHGIEGIDAFALAYPAIDRKSFKRLVQASVAVTHHHGTARKSLRHIRELDDALLRESPDGAHQPACVPPTVSASISSDG